mmetsp:Transcript_25404/g.39194  ORF Transcript_25404/g.39194 Transcript_25404/m.39194 type:complete len:122 (-) Transcript_25404:601-966(-)
MLHLVTDLGPGCFYHIAMSVREVSYRLLEHPVLSINFGGSIPLRLHFLDIVPQLLNLLLLQLMFLNLLIMEINSELVEHLLLSPHFLSLGHVLVILLLLREAEVLLKQLTALFRAWLVIEV